MSTNTASYFPVQEIGFDNLVYLLTAGFDASTIDAELVFRHC